MTPHVPIEIQKRNRRLRQLRWEARHKAKGLKFPEGAAKDGAMRRFLAKVDKGLNNESCCWNWTAWTASNGYGRFWNGVREVPAHHFLLPPVPEGMFACHRCDNKLCVRPDHIFIGTQKENIQDCIRKGRVANPGKKLTREQVEAIRRHHFQKGDTMRMAKELGVVHTTITNIRKGVSWKSALAWDAASCLT